ncbi:hypothetical protein SLS64_012679 [Diaporthe eres]|uniref:Amidase domain-containing protein n=1 Tax=Diaporthe eres TaxID=83184 RepID=A0ABR1NTR7_DIAER
MASFYLLGLYVIQWLLLVPLTEGRNVVVRKEAGTHKAQSYAIPSLIDATIDELAEGLDSGAFTSVDLVNAYIARILEVNSTLHMVTEINPDAVAIAEQLDNERSNGTSRGPLHGIPILIKNNIATADQMNNTAGSWSLVGAKVPRDSQVARKLRESGVVILGKTNLSQWANYRSNNSTNGWSAYGGQVYGAFYPNQDPSGSSSGSGVASSIGLALASLGTETDGSIVSPSDVNNLVGIKPTVGLTSRNLVIPISEHQDTVGPMARTVKDAAYILSAIAGEDPYDNYTSAIPFKNGTIPDYVKACKIGALSGARIGVARNLMDASYGVDTIANASSAANLAAFQAALDVLRDAGATVVEGANFTAVDQWFNDSSTETIGLDADFIVNLVQYLDELTENPNDITDLVTETAFTHGFPAEDWPDRDTAIWDGALARGFNNTSPQFWDAHLNNLAVGGPGGILGALERDNLDAVVSLTAVSSSFPALVGSPIVTVPLGFFPNGTSVVPSQRELIGTAPGIPFGFAFMGARFSEEKLIGLAYDFEQKTLAQQKGAPYIVPTTELADVISA